MSRTTPPTAPEFRTDEGMRRGGQFFESDHFALPSPDLSHTSWIHILCHKRLINESGIAQHQCWRGSKSSRSYQCVSGWDEGWKGTEHTYISASFCTKTFSHHHASLCPQLLGTPFNLPLQQLVFKVPQNFSAVFTTTGPLEFLQFT